ncbi:MAG: hypothetical protein MUF34_36730 [Polyangiaceae bacterium]|nr:hypothetical protein [Polyangiaceae bacterium]
MVSTVVILEGRSENAPTQDDDANRPGAAVKAEGSSAAERPELLADSLFCDELVALVKGCITRPRPLL